MFDFIRTHQRMMQLVLLLLILPSFALIGVSGYTNYVSGDEDLVKVGGSAITLKQFDDARRNQLERLQQNSQGGFDPSVLDNPAARGALLESLVDRRVLVTTATEERLSVSDVALRQAIASMPQLQVDGKFSPERYNQVLAQAGLTTRDFEQGQRAELSLDRVLAPVGLTASVPPTVSERLEAVLTEERTVRLLAFAATDYQNDVGITDDDIKAWYEQNKQRLELPEQVSTQYLLLNEAAAMENLPEPKPEDLQAYYEQNKARYVQPARINVSHIQINVPAGASDEQRAAAKAKADEIANKAQAAGADFAALAKAESQDAGTAKDGGKLGWITQGSWPAALEAAVFALDQGGVSGVVQGPGGYHIFHANEVQSQKGQSFDEAKPKIEVEVRRQLGAERFADMATRLTSLVYDNPTSLQPAADALGIKIRSAAGIARDRLLSSDEVGANAASASEDAAVLDDIRVRRALFTQQALVEKQNSGVIEISPDTMVAVRVENITPAHVPPLEKLSAYIKEQLTAERARAAAEKAGQEALAAFRESKDTANVPEKFGTPLEITRISPQGLDKLVLDAAFSAPAKSLPAYAGVTGPQGFVVVRVESARPGNPNEPLLAGLSTELTQAWGRAEEQAVLNALREQAKVTMLPESEKVLAGDTD
ncbi:MAG TPA: SurA N-terminal domain-containing protein [Candidimonas sp.]|nr:SurA N-terminal domain-containing protein [Candidimonas sp.]